MITCDNDDGKKKREKDKKKKMEGWMEKGEKERQRLGVRHLRYLAGMNRSQNVGRNLSGLALIPTEKHRNTGTTPPTRE